MKKLNLTPSTFQKGDVLTRSQLKQISGGDYGSGGGGNSGGGGGGGGGFEQTCILTIVNAPPGNADYSNMPGERGLAYPKTREQAQVWCMDFEIHHSGATCNYSCNN